MQYPGKWLATARNQDYEAGIRAFEEGRYEEAIPHFQACLSECDDPAAVRLARFYLGESFSCLGSQAISLGAWQRAEGWLRAAAEFHPTHADIHYKLAYVSRKLGRPAEALASVSRAIELNPKYSRAILLQALIWFESGRERDALARIRSAGYHDATVDFRMVHEALAGHAAGEKDLFYFRMEKALQERCSEAETALEAGELAFREGRYEDALHFFTEGLEKGPGYADLHCRRGECLLELGDADGAFLSFQNALHINPNYLDAQYHAARALMAMKREVEAREVLSSILRLSPEHLEARSLLDEAA